MKKLLIPAIAFAAAGSAAAVEDNNMRANVGVGLGTIIWEGVGWTDTTLAQAFAFTTNATFCNQTFFITTGTGGAKKTSGFVRNQQLREFVEQNLDVLAREMATGHGESLDALAELAGIEASQRAAFFARVQQQYAQIFPNADVTSDQVIAGLERCA